MSLAAATVEITTDDLNGYSDEELKDLGGIMFKDESTCIRCGLCASRCPTKAIKMQKFDFYRECVTIDTVNSRLRPMATQAAV